MADLDGWQVQATEELDRLVMETVPEAGRITKWKQPTYEYHGLLCYFKAFKSHVNFGFFRGAELDDPEGLLEGTAESMRHVKLKSLDQINEDALVRLVKAAAELNRQ